MREQTRNKTSDKSPVRIRPPDQNAFGISTEPSDAAWTSALSVPSVESVLQRWLSVEQVRKMQRMRRESRAGSGESFFDAVRR